tara:strand:+ start:135 stop:566 length:432 start_codon:yes stop_codon:yes gene_type:complete
MEDIHHRALYLLTAAAGIATVAQAAEPRLHGNETGSLACGLVFMAYVVHLIGVLEYNTELTAAGTNIAMFAHGWQLAYYYYEPLPASLMLPPLCIGALFILYVSCTCCGLPKRLTHTQATTTEGLAVGSEDESKVDMDDIELV